ncbi:MAG: NACHT domain-containing protein [Pseudonocardiaceae bacterium]
MAAVERLVTWATDSAESAPTLCALLGDVGMGKTTTTKLLTEELLDRRDRDPGGPLPILFDLRDLPSDVFRGGPNLRRIVEALLDASDVRDRRPAADGVLDLVARGNCVLIFDGLDEVLVRLDPYQGQNFTRTLWRATEGTWQTSPVDQPGRPRSRPDRPSKLLLSSRTHYFRSIRDETTHFTGQHRDGPAASNYLALLMLPFDDGQIRDYLRANLPDADVDRLLDLIDSVHNLREIAERPLTLRMITEQLELMERAKLVGRPVRAVDLYASFVEQWLARDQGKHSLLPA